MIFQGIVVRGQQLGRKLGFPTANVKISDLVLEPIVSCCILSLGEELFYGVGTYLAHKKVYEVYIFDFDRDIYGCELKVELRQKIRNNKKFDSIKLLQEQIEQDVLTAKSIFANT